MLCDHLIGNFETQAPYMNGLKICDIQIDPFSDGDNGLKKELFSGGDYGFCLCSVHKLWIGPLRVKLPYLDTLTRDAYPVFLK